VVSSHRGGGPESVSDLYISVVLHCDGLLCLNDISGFPNVFLQDHLENDPVHQSSWTLVCDILVNRSKITDII